MKMPLEPAKKVTDNLEIVIIKLLMEYEVIS